MGIIFGKTGTKGPSYEVLLKAPQYEIRKYSSYITAEVPISSKEDEGKAFGALAKYIGVFGKPENEISKPMAMTHPVITDPPESLKLAMTSPVITEQGDAALHHNNMKFVLPEEFKTIESCPRPTNPNVLLRLVPPKFVAVLGFSGMHIIHSYTCHQSTIIRLFPTVI